MKKRILEIVGGLAIAVAALPFLMNGEHVVIDAAYRANLTDQGHTFIQGRAGHIHYALTGPRQGPLVVLLHGVSGPMEVWEAALPALHAEGFRTLHYDHYGRGHSDRVNPPYNLDLFVGGLEDLLNEITPSKPVVVFGSSMGALVASEFTLRHPDRVRALGLFGPAGFPLQATILAKLIGVPGVGEYIMKVAGDRSLAAHNRKYFHNHTPFEAFFTRFETQLRVVGTKDAILSTMRHTPVQTYSERYARLDQKGPPILLVWGEQDGTFPFALHSQAQTLLPKAQFVAVPKAGHLPMFERPDIVNPHIIRFLISTSSVSLHR